MPSYLTAVHFLAGGSSQSWLQPSPSCHHQYDLRACGHQLPRHDVGVGGSAGPLRFHYLWPPRHCRSRRIRRQCRYDAGHAARGLHGHMTLVETLRESRYTAWPGSPPTRLRLSLPDPSACGSTRTRRQRSISLGPLTSRVYFA